MTTPQEDYDTMRRYLILKKKIQSMGPVEWAKYRKQIEECR